MTDAEHIESVIQTKEDAISYLKNMRNGKQKSAILFELIEKKGELVQKGEFSYAYIYQRGEKNLFCFVQYKGKNKRRSEREYTTVQEYQRFIWEHTFSLR